MPKKWVMFLAATSMILAGCSRSAKTFVDDSDKAYEGILREGPAVLFTFDNGVTNSGSTRYQVSAQGVLIEEDGRFAGAGRFGQGASITVGKARINAEGSWCLWLRPDADQKEREQRLLDGNGYVIGILDKRLFMTYHDGKARTITGPAVPSGEWMHVAMTWSTNSLRMYVNGEILGQHMLNGKSGFPIRTITAGARWTGGTMAFTGLLDDICIFDRALSDAEVKRLASTGLAAGWRPSANDSRKTSATHPTSASGAAEAATGRGS
jgi:hypothetical protein